MKTKRCTKCKIEKPLSDFYNSKSGKFGVVAVCKKCIKIYANKNKEKIQKRMKKWYKNNKDIVKINRKKYYQNNKEKITLYQEKNKEHLFLKRKERLEKNKKKIAKQHKQWRIKNLIRINKVRRTYLNNRYNTDINFKLECNLRTRMWFALKQNTKSKRTLELLGCSVEFLKKHLESQFKEGMTWANQGHKGWHIDHIKPCSLFDLTDPKQQEQCFHYTNLQPLWATNNLSKGTKYVTKN